MKSILTRILIGWLFSVPMLLAAQVTADFSGTPLSGCSPLVVQFTDLSTGPVTGWQWNFGNGNTSTLQNPAAVYVTPGTYTVTLTVTDGVNNDTQTFTNYITVFNNPTANFVNATPRTGCNPLNVCFTDLSTPGDGAINQWLWDFGDGNTAIAQNPCHTYTQAGNYTVSLVVTDVNGCNNTVVFTNYVSVSDAPVAGFTANPTAACDPPLTVNFTNTTTGGQAPVTYTWDFGDGNTGAGANPIHTYTNYGSYDVTLIATDANGCADTLVIPQLISISNFTADFSVANPNICEGQAANFTDLTAGGPNQWNWDFGDGGTSTVQNPSHVYANAGTYTVTLVAGNAACTDDTVYTALVTVDPAPVADFVADTTFSCEAPLTVGFTDLSTGGPTAWQWDFGDGNTSNAQNPTHTYANPGTYTVTLIATGPNGCTDTLVIPDYIVIEPPVADFVANPLMGCRPLLVQFTDLSISPDPIVTWEWDFGDGNTGLGQNPAHTYTTTGAFDVTLIITTALGCTDTLVRPAYIQVGDPPVACFTVNPTLACVNEPINFTDCSTNATGWFWDFGDGGTSTAQNPQYAYQDTGCFTVTLIASNFGCTDDTIIQNVVCITPPVARFNLNPVVGCAVPHTVFFTDQSILPDTWFWDFGDGNTSTAQNPIHTYTSPGAYTVTLTVTDTVSGCQDDAQANVNISIPVADFTGAPLFGCGPLTTNFTDNSSSQVPITNWQWDFGDGNTSTQQNPTHTYQNPGTYTVTLTITDANGCTATQTRPNYVQVIGPNVNFGADTLGGCDSLLVNFTDSTVFGAPITSWLWDFGDGNTSTLQNPSHLYANPGQYTVSLTVTDLDGCSRTLTRPAYISVTSPVAGFTVNDTIACAGVTLNFNNTSTGVGLNYDWDFGDGNGSTATNPNHAYVNNGTYDVTLVVVDVNGCTDTASVPALADIRDVQANFGAIPTNASCPPLLVSFTDSSDWDIVTWQWDFGDGTGSTLPNPSHVYTMAGSYDVSLIVTNDDGCTDTLLVPGLVNIQGPNGTFTFAPDSGCTPQDVLFQATATNTASFTWDFGDGNVGITTVDSVVHTYTQTGTFFPILILDDGLGCTFSIISPDSIVIDTIPFVDFAIDTNVICGLDSVRFTDLTFSTRPITAWFWDFGDGNTDSIQNPVHLYAGPGQYNVTLGVVNSLGCTDTITLPAAVSIFDPPIAVFNPTDSTGCDPFPVPFVDSSYGNQPITGWAWDFGDGNTDNVQNPFHTYIGTGNYPVSLIVTDSAGCQDTTFGTIAVNPGPTAGFVADDSSGCPPHPVQFTANGGMGIVLYTWDFGDGSPPATGNPVSHTYTQAGNFTVTLIVEDTLGCTDTLVRPQYININPPVADFTQNNTSGCPPLTVTFTDASTFTNNIVNWAWDFGDGNTGTGTPVTHTYQQAGVYTVTLVITDSEGCMDTIVKPNLIEVFTPPTASFVIDDTTGCRPFTIELLDTSVPGSAPVTAWAWTFGDGNTSNLQNPTNAYQNAGTYLITLIVTDANGCQDTASMSFTSPPPPLANFQAQDSIGCAPFPTVFTADTTGGIIFFEWDFGDGSPLANGNPVNHTYTQSGNFTVTLIVEDVYGCRDTLTKPNYIQINPPAADFTGINLNGCPPLLATFNDNSSTTYPIVSWEWDFGDGNTGTGAPVNHTYQQPGTYTVTLIVTDSIGCRDTIVQPNFVEVFQPPSALFGITDTLACDPFTIQLTDSSVAAAAPLTAWDWDFGDGNTGTAQNPTHAYANPGPYTITLIATDANGCRDTFSLPFVVPVRPEAAFVASDSQGCAPFDVLFIADSTDIVSWYWEFGDGSDTLAGPTVLHNYPLAGTYTVTLVIQDIYGCSDTLTRPNYIFVDSLDADYTMNIGTGCPPLPVDFFDASYSDTTIVSWAWNFGDGGTSNQQNPTHIYQNPGQYQVTLIVTNAIGCVDTVADSTITIYDIDPPAAPPILMATVLSNTADSISWLAYQGPDFSHYVLWWESPVGTNNWVPVDSFFNQLDTTYTHTGLNTLQNSYCYRMQVVDICGIRSDLDSSQRHCTINLEATPGIDQAVLNWNAYIGWNAVDRYDIFRVNDYDPNNVQFLGTVPGGTTSYIDSAVVCYEDYCYRVLAHELGGFNERSWSDTSCASPIHIPNPPAMEICAASVQGDSSVEISWSLPPGADATILYLEKSTDGQNWSTIGVFPPNVSQYLDLDVNVQATSYYYQISYVDSCGDASPVSNLGRTMVLEASLAGNSPFLTWNQYQDWAAGVLDYQIQVLNSATGQWQTVENIAGMNTSYTDLLTNLDQPIYCYRVWANQAAGLCRSLSNISCVPVGPLLFAPNAFTPNGDGLNDEFELKGHFIADYNIRIFDRWGALIFESNDLGTHWDGTWRDKPAQEGVYVWVARARGFDGTEIELRGTATLIR